MAELVPALAYMLSNETPPWWSDTPTDLGGETYAGISRKNWPDWPGWDRVGSMKQSPDGMAALKAGTDGQLSSTVADFYRENFWQFDGIENQDVAAKLLDMSVNQGKSTAVMLAQKGLKRLIAGPIVPDGVLGPVTVSAINSVEPSKMLRALRAESALRYMDILRANPSQAINAAGWLWRAAGP